MKRLFVIALFLLLPATGFAAAASTDSNWQWRVAPYLWAAGLDGEVGVSGVGRADVDVGFSDILDNLEFAGMVAVEARRADGLLAIVDFDYLALGADGSAGPLDVEVDLDAIMALAAVGYRVVDNADTPVDLFAGARLMWMNTEIDIRGVADGDDSESWVDPVVGVRASAKLGERWGAALAGSVGGFGAASDLLWTVLPAVYYGFTESITGLVGYRILDYEYDNDDFIFDVATEGIIAGVTFEL